MKVAELKRGTAAPSSERGHRLDRRRLGTRCARLCDRGAVALSQRMPGDFWSVRLGRAVSQPHRDGAAWLRPRRIQILRLSAAKDDRRVARCALSRAGPDRQSLERADGHRRAVPGNARRISAALPQGRPDQADAVAAAVWGRRLQLPAPGPVRRARVSAADRDPALRARHRLHRRRVRADRAAAAHAVARRGGAAAAGRGRDLSRCIIGPCRARAGCTG